MEIEERGTLLKKRYVVMTFYIRSVHFLEMKRIESAVEDTEKNGSEGKVNIQISLFTSRWKQ